MPASSVDSFIISNGNSKVLESSKVDANGVQKSNLDDKFYRMDESTKEASDSATSLKYMIYTGQW